MAETIGKPFEKGKSGNPGGRKPIPPEIKEMARGASPRAMERAIEWIEHEDANISLKAIQLVVERAYGKPVQETDMRLSADDTIASLLARVAANGRKLHDPG